MNSHGDNSNESVQGGTGGADTKVETGDDEDENPEKQAARLEHEIEEIRDNLGGLVSELDHRRHRLNPLNIVGDNPLPFIVAGVVIVGAVWGGIALHNARERERHSLVGRGRRLQEALRRAMDKPDKVAVAEPNIGVKLLTAAGTAAAAVMARKLVTRLVARDS